MLEIASCFSGVGVAAAGVAVSQSAKRVFAEGRVKEGAVARVWVPVAFVTVIGTQMSGSEVVELYEDDVVEDASELALVSLDSPCGNKRAMS